MPHEPQVYRWLTLHESFRELYVRAREDQAHMLAEQIIAISDDNTRDTYLDDDGNEIVKHDHINRSRLRVESRKWYAAKLNAKVYGDKTSQEISGPEGGPVSVTWLPLEK